MREPTSKNPFAATVAAFVPPDLIDRFDAAAEKLVMRRRSEHVRRRGTRGVPE